MIPYYSILVENPTCFRSHIPTISYFHGNEEADRQANQTRDSSGNTGIERPYTSVLRVKEKERRSSIVYRSKERKNYRLIYEREKKNSMPTAKAGSVVNRPVRPTSPRIRTGRQLSVRPRDAADIWIMDGDGSVPSPAVPGGHLPTSMDFVQCTS